MRALGRTDYALLGDAASSQSANSRCISCLDEDLALSDSGQVSDHN